MAKSYGQFDQGAGQSYAERGKKRKAETRSSAARSRPSKKDSGPSYEDKVRGDMKEYRKRVLQFGRTSEDRED